MLEVVGLEAPQHGVLHRLGHALEHPARLEHVVELAVVGGDGGRQVVVHDPIAVGATERAGRQRGELVEVERLGVVLLVEERREGRVLEEALHVGVLDLIGGVLPPLVEQQVHPVLSGVVEGGDQQLGEVVVDHRTIV